MKYKWITKGILQHLGITKCYSGYDYILYGIDLIMDDERFLTCVTKVLYIDIAKKYHTSHTCVERNIRKVIEVIWNHREENRVFIIKIFGEQYANRKPSNKYFLHLLYDYVAKLDLQKQLIENDELICPISKNVCTVYKEFIEKFLFL